MEKQVRNIFVSTNGGDNYLFYVFTKFEKITEKVVADFVKMVFDEDVIEAYEVPQKDLQYYCIDERFYVSTQEVADKMLKAAQIVERSKQ